MDPAKSWLFAFACLVCLQADAVVAPGPGEVCIARLEGRAAHGLEEASFEAVMEAYRPSASAAKFADLGVLSEDMQNEWANVPLRNDPRDRMAVQLIAEKIEDLKRLGCLVIVDIGHAHSIAAATILAQNGWQPVVKMKEYRYNPTMTLQSVAAMKYHAHAMLRARQNFNGESPIALIMDVHRNAAAKNNSFPQASFPSAEQVKAQYNNCIVHIDEGYNKDLHPLTGNVSADLKHFAGSNVELFEFTVNPSNNGTQGGAVTFR